MRRAFAATMAAAVLTATVLTATGACGSGGSGGGLTVLAAASLTGPFRDLTRPAGRAGLHPAFSFGGTPALVEQVRQGAPADLIAAADVAQLGPLVARHLVERPVVFARNRLVVVVPAAGGSPVRSVADLGRPGVRVVLAGPAVPAGKYARRALEELGLLVAVDAHVVSNEDDVKGVAAKVALGEADAGIVYVSDARADRRLRVVGAPLPGEANYAAAVVTAGHRDRAERFLRLLRSAEGRRVLRAAGFTPA